MAQAAPTLNQTASGTSSITIPPATAVGDLMVLAVILNLNTTPTAPAGWTATAVIECGGGNYFYLCILTRRAVAGDPGSVITPFPSASQVLSQMSTWTNAGSDAIVVGTAGIVSYGQQSASSGTITAPSFTTSDANSAVLQMWAFQEQETGGFSLTIPSTATQPVTTATYSPGATLENGIGVSYQTQATAGTAPSQTASWSDIGNGGSYGSIGVQIALPPIQAPAAPTLTSPANASYEDMSGTPTFTWVYNPTTGDGSQNAVAIRQKLSGGPSYNYWNNSTHAWQSSIVWNSYTTQTLTFPSGAWSNGNIYNWSVATQEATENLQSAFASDFTVTAQAPPSVTVTGPTGTIGATSPTVTATASVASGASLTAYRVVVYTAAQVGAPGFTPGGTPDVYDSGTVASSNLSISQPLPANTLSNNVTYYTYVQVTETGGETSPWSYLAFTVSYDAPAQPTVSAVVGTDGTTGYPIVTVTVQAHDNIVSAADASFEGSLGTWTAGSNTTITDSTTEARDGSYSMEMTAASTGSAAASNDYTSYTVVGGDSYTAMAYFWAGSTGRSCTVALNWYTSGGTLISTSTSGSVTDTTSAWTQAAVTATAPSNAAHASLTVTVAGCAASEIHYVDCTGLFPGTDTTWTRGGLVGSTYTVVTRSDGLQVRGASAANPLTVPSPSQTAVVSDYECVPGVAYTYTATVSALISGNLTVTSPTGTSADVTVTTTQWWEIDPTNPSSAVAAQPVAWQPAQIEQSTAHQVLGQTVMSIIANTMLNQDFTGTFEIFDSGVYTAFQALLTGQKTVFISSPWGTTDSGYFRVGPQPGGMSTGAGNTAKNTQLLPSTSAGPHRTVAVTAVAAARPVV